MVIRLREQKPLKVKFPQIRNLKNGTPLIVTALKI